MSAKQDQFDEVRPLVSKDNPVGDQSKGLFPGMPQTRRQNLFKEVQDKEKQIDSCMWPL